MPKFKNKKSYRRVQRQREQRRIEEKKSDIAFERWMYRVSLVLFIAGFMLFFYQPWYFFLMVFFMAASGYRMLNAASKAVLGKKLILFSDYMQASDGRPGFSDLILNILLFMWMALFMLICWIVRDYFLGTDTVTQIFR